MKTLNKLLLSTTLSCFAANIAYGSESIWPSLDSDSGPVHKRIVGSVLGRTGDDYLGGQYHGKRFVLMGNQSINRENRPFTEHLPVLRQALDNGRKVEIKPVGSLDEIRNFRKHILYSAFIDGQKIGHSFSLFNKEKLDNFQTFRINGHRLDVPEESDENQTSSIARQFGNIDLGVGLNTSWSLSSSKRRALMEKYKDHRVLKHAFNIIKGADLAVAVDRANLMSSIQNNNVRIGKEELLDFMRHDRRLITEAANSLRVGDQYERVYRPFVDQLHALGNQGHVKGYSGRQGIDGAIRLLKDNNSLLRGEIPESLRNVTGSKAIHLRLALFYVNAFKNKKAGRLTDLSKLKTFYKGNYFGANPETIEGLLKQTSLFQDGYFYSPDNGYVKNADQETGFNSQDLNHVRLNPSDQSHYGDYRMVNADCSGFAEFVARRLHPNNHELNNRRHMTYQLAPVYDYLANKAKGTSNKFYGANGAVCNLTYSEKDKLSDYKYLGQRLESVYEPVLNAKNNIQPGDIIIHRNGDAEGHAMIAVEQNPNDKGLVKVIELTGFGSYRGYNWTEIRLKSGETNNSKHRVLRIKR